jgi:hypothetical protein
MAIAESTLPTSEIASAVSNEMMGKVFFCVMAGYFARRALAASEQNQDKYQCDNQRKEPKDPAHSSAVAVSELVLQPIGFRFLLALGHLESGFSIEEGIVEHDISP